LLGSAAGFGDTFEPLAERASLLGREHGFQFGLAAVDGDAGMLIALSGAAVLIIDLRPTRKPTESVPVEVLKLAARWP
jgi:hypothetical protein